MFLQEFYTNKSIYVIISLKLKGDYHMSKPLKTSSSKNNHKKIGIIIVIVVLSVVLIVLITFLILFLLGVINETPNKSVPDNTQPSTYIVEPIDAESYYEENGEILNVIKTKNSKEILSEKEAIELLNDRGFTNSAITWNFTEDGEYLEDTEAKTDSDTKHPTYSTFYIASTDDYWTVEIVNGCITASSINYNITSSSGVPLIVSEKKTVMGYDNISNQFFETIPKDTSLKVQIVEKIDAHTLDELSKKGS